ncbi:hypothetical protein QTG54_010196 [Skeletonema marinoi]|uniref:Uncharacterized protein n=1 Tax=Skeletonema marinoi TaxID=267567 RepID=A0AAD8Y4A3_9STRA|nr:hypothetical protein QTG54_010196 [Skeletonema marinoi]
MGKAAEHTDDPAISKGLIAFFMFVVIGSSIVQILRMFQTSVPNLRCLVLPPREQEEGSGGATSLEYIFFILSCSHNNHNSGRMSGGRS